MARLNLFDPSLPEPDDLPRLTSTINAPGCPDLTLTLEALDPFGLGAATDKAEQYIADYLPRGGQAATQALTIPGKRQPRLSKGILADIAMLEAMQVPDEGDEPYGIIDWLVLIVRYRGLWRGALKLSGDVQKLLKEQEGNVSGAATATPSA